MVKLKGCTFGIYKDSNICIQDSTRPMTYIAVLSCTKITFVRATSASFPEVQPTWFKALTVLP